MNYVDTIAHASTKSKYQLLVNGNLNVEDAAIIYKNFSGKPTIVNPSGGKRTFSLALNKEFGARLSEMGWNVKVKEVRDQLEEGEKTRTVNWPEYESTYATEFDHALIYTEIVANENSEYPPKIYRVSEFNGEKTMSLIPPEQWGRLDDFELTGIDLVVHPYTHGRSIANPNAKKGYLKSMYAVTTPVDDGFGGKYADYRMVGED